MDDVLTFRLDPAPTFSWPVGLTAPGGKKHVLELVYRYKTREEAAAWRKKAVAAPNGDEAALLLEVVDGWNNCDEPFSPAAFTRLLNAWHGAAEEIFVAYFEGLRGARAGN